jgi:hypothetical protein
MAASGRKLFLVPLQSASIVAASGRNLFWFLFGQHLLWLHLAGGQFLVSFKSVSIVSASGGKFCFWFLFSQLLFGPHLVGSLFLVPFKSASIVAASGGNFFSGFF